MYLSPAGGGGCGGLGCCPVEDGGSLVVDSLFYVPHKLFVGVLFWLLFFYALL